MSSSEASSEEPAERPSEALTTSDRVEPNSEGADPDARDGVHAKEEGDDTAGAHEITPEQEHEGGDREEGEEDLPYLDMGVVLRVQSEVIREVIDEVIREAIREAIRKANREAIRR
jgi:hypothetical protein